MRLVVVSDMTHRLDDEGELVGWGPTVRELDHLTGLFDEIVHVAPLHPGAPSAVDRRYASGHVEVRPVRPAGGPTIRAKLGVLGRIPSWVSAIRSELRRADAVHVRCPANVSLVALMVLALGRRPRLRWVKYAGNWSPRTKDAASYRLQRWMLRRNVPRAAVTVNGSWNGEPRHVHTFVNPAISVHDLRAAAEAARGKTPPGGVRILFAGRLEQAKGVPRVLEIAARLAAADVPFHVDLAGGGAERGSFESVVAARGLRDSVTFHGWLDRTSLDHLYAGAHFVVVPSAAEGFPKVLAEGMAFGAVPIAGDVSRIGQVLAAAGTGTSVPPSDVDAFVTAILDRADGARWHRESAAAVDAAGAYTYERYLDAVRSLFESSFGVGLPGAARGSRRVSMPMRVGIFGPHLGANDGWVVSQGETLAALLSDAGHEVHHASTRPGRLARAVDTATTVLRVGGSLDVAVVSVFSGAAFAVAEMTDALAATRGVPVVLALHGGDLPSFARRHPPRVGRLLARARIVVAPSPYLAEALSHLRDDIAVVPNALPLAAYPTRRRAALRPRLLWMRTFEPMYRPEMALEVLRRLRVSDPCVTLTMAGQDRGLLRPMRAKAIRLGIGDAVHFAGFLGPSQKLRAFEEHDVFLSTSVVDNAPVSVLEAATSGLAIVATNAGGISDLLADGTNGLLVPDRDSVAMAAAVRRVLDNPSLAGCLSDGARQLGAGSNQHAVERQWQCIMESVSPSRRSRIDASQRV